MRNLPQHIHKEFGKKNIILLQKMERSSQKMVDVSNDRRFTLRCLGAGITLVIVNLKSTIITSESCEIIRKQKGNYLMNLLGPSTTPLN